MGTPNARSPRPLVAALSIGAAVVCAALGLTLIAVVAMSMGGDDSEVVVPALAAEVFIAALAVSLARYGMRAARRN